MQGSLALQLESGGSKAGAREPCPGGACADPGVSVRTEPGCGAPGWRRRTLGSLTPGAHAWLSPHPSHSPQLPPPLCLFAGHRSYLNPSVCPVSRHERAGVSALGEVTPWWTETLPQPCGHQLNWTLCDRSKVRTPSPALTTADGSTPPAPQL